MTDVDKKILQFRDILKDLRVIRFNKEFNDTLGVARQNIHKVKEGKAHFTVEHCYILSDVYNANLNWIYGHESNVFRKKEVTKSVTKT